MALTSSVPARASEEEADPHSVQGLGSAVAFEALAEVEERLPSVVPAAARPGRYHRYREWLIRSAVLRQVLARNARPGGRAVPGLEMPAAVGPRLRRTLRLTGALLDARRTLARSARADAVFANSNLRAFYLSQAEPATVKIALHPPAASAHPLDPTDARDGAGTPETALRREVEARRYAARFLNIPPLLDADLSAALPFLVEPLVWGTRPVGRAAATACRRLVPRLVAMYEDHGYRFRTPAELLGGEDALVELEAALAFLGTPGAVRAGLVEAVQRLLAVPRGVALSFTHGDLAPTNLVIDGSGEVYVLDWERAGEDLVARDLCMLLREAPHCYEHVAEAAQRSQSAFAPAGEICSLPEQLATVGALALTRWQYYREQCRRGARDPRDVRRQLGYYRDLVEALDATGGHPAVGPARGRHAQRNGR